MRLIGGLVLAQTEQRDTANEPCAACQQALTSASSMTMSRWFGASKQAALKPTMFSCWQERSSAISLRKLACAETGFRTSSDRHVICYRLTERAPKWHT